MIEEPSVLDYLKSRLAAWRKKPLAIFKEVWGRGDLQPEMNVSAEETFAPKAAESKPQPSLREKRWTLVALSALAMALMAQGALEPPGRLVELGIILYLVAALGIVLACWGKGVVLSKIPDREDHLDSLTLKPFMLIVGFVSAMLAFWEFGSGQFNTLNMILWFLAVFFIIRGLWLNPTGKLNLINRLVACVRRSRLSLSISRKFTTNDRVQLRFEFLFPKWNLRISRDFLVLVCVVVLVLFFRLYRLNQVPPEMVSDHAEKLLDVGDVLNGKTSIFFPRNTGREGLQMYLTAGIILLFNTDLSFLSLKIGMALAGLLTLPYIYMLGKEFGRAQTGLFAALFAGIAYWPNVISRIALRFTLYPLFVAPTLYYLIRGLRTANRNDFILAGIFLGVGLHGYLPFRIVPLVVVVGVLLYLLHNRIKEVWKQTLVFLLVLAFVAMIIFLPLLRYAVDNPGLFSYRALTRMASLEKPLGAPASRIFIQNLWNALTMFGYDNGEVWVVSIPHRPALSAVSAALFHIGILFVLIRYLQRRHWQDIYLLLSIPLLMLPSILSLAFPAENPVLNRTAGALVPAFLLVGIALDSLLTSINTKFSPGWGRLAAWGLGLFLLLWAGVQDYDLVFRQYQDQYTLSAWNTTELGAVIRNFSQGIGSPDSAWVVAYPYWVDTRLVGINAGYPDMDFAIRPEDFPATVDNPNTKLFLLSPEDQEGLGKLQQLYPSGVLQEYSSKVVGKNFLMYYAPSASQGQ